MHRDGRAKGRHMTGRRQAQVRMGNHHFCKGFGQFQFAGSEWIGIQQKASRRRPGNIGIAVRRGADIQGSRRAKIARGGRLQRQADREQSCLTFRANERKMKRPLGFFGNRGDIERLKMAPELPRGPDVAWDRLKDRVGKREFRYGNALVTPLYPDISGRGSW